MEPSWARLGAVLAPPPGLRGVILGPLGALLEALGVLLEALGGLLGASWGRLEAILDVFSRITAKCSKMQPLPREMLIFAFKLKPRWGQVGPKMGHVGLKLGSGWHLEAILPASCRHLAILSRLGGNLGELMPKKEPKVIWR